MLRRKRNLIITILLLQLIVFSFLIINVLAATNSIVPESGKAPEIDGKISSDQKEWQNATKTSLNLYTNWTDPGTDKGIPIDLWVMENETYLYISIQFYLEVHSSTEFIGILISDSTQDDDDNFIDAKIVQFSDINDNDFSFKDYYIENSVFKKDSDKNGNGAAKLNDENEVVYEFSIPINNSYAESDDEDVFLDFGEEYAFKIIYGETSDYINGVKKSNVVIISIEYPPKPPEREFWVDVHNILLIIIFIGTGAISGFYIYKILLLNKKLERLTENA
ncbi:MAG: hypothetical protein ACTSR8_18745 [Promethearchaeota archaeon]